MATTRTKAGRRDGAAPDETAAGNRPDRQEAPSNDAPGFYIHTQGETAKVVQAQSRPSTTPEPGGRMIELEGPFQTREAADARLAILTEGQHARRLRLSKERSL